MSGRRWLYGALALLLFAALVIGVRIIYPPVKVLVMTTGMAGSAYDVFAQQYKEILAREGIELRLEPSAGAVENLRRLNDPRSRVSVGFSQGGLTSVRESPDLVSLGTMFYEPLWFFCRGDGCGQRVRDLRGKKISIGPEGSGTRALADRLLALNGFDDAAVERLSFSAAESAEPLLRGEIDAAAMVASWSTPAVRKLLASTDAELLDFPRADAYVALYPYLTKLTVPAGVGSMAANRPPSDVHVLALKASLIVRKDMDSALQSVLLDAAMQIHSGADIFEKASQFPAPEAGDLPVSADAIEFYKSGRPFFQRYLPFRLAQLAGRLLVVLIPLIGVVYPLIRFAPALYGWSMRRRVFRLYGDLKLIEADLDAHATDAATLLRRLDHLEERADHLQVPLAFAQTLYHMRSHIGLARARLQSQPAAPPEQAPNGR
ncbi:MAG TPA: TAXI family TRAP transporter solute-binding subunit [Gammaproteobacteria bacterium]|nr:TAXI family TRAP transporter solute-binding subunit [Gammaproteobacteria bacterium]